MRLILHTVLNLTCEWTQRWVSASWRTREAVLLDCGPPPSPMSFCGKEGRKEEGLIFIRTYPGIRALQGTYRQRCPFWIFLWSCSRPLEGPLQLSSHKIISFCGIIFHVQNLQNLVMPRQKLWYGYCISLAWHFQCGNHHLEMVLVHWSNKPVLSD